VPLLIPEFSRAIGQSAPRDYRDAVNDQAQLGFGGIEFRGGTSELGTILNHHSTSCRARDLALKSGLWFAKPYKYLDALSTRSRFNI
jgi:hypothetical protein